MLKLKSTITEMKKIQQMGSRGDLNWQKKESVNLKVDQQRLPNLKGKRKRNEQSLRDLGDTIKYMNIYVMGVQEEKKMAKNNSRSHDKKLPKSGT